MKEKIMTPKNPMKSEERSVSLKMLIEFLIIKYGYTGKEEYAEKRVDEFIEKLKAKGEFKKMPTGRIVFSKRS